MSEVSRLGETRRIYAESNRDKVNTFTTVDTSTTYQQYAVALTTNLATGLPSTIQGESISTPVSLQIAGTHAPSG